MTQPTKEQVLKRMVEIEFPGKMKGPGSWVCDSKDSKGVMHGLFTWDPLDTPSDWAVLIEKYVQTIEKHPDSPNIKEHWRGKYTVLTLDDAGVATHESLPWAICLAIIESKGGMGDE